MTPRVTVVVPVRNEEANIGGLLDRLEKLQGEDTEFLVVDDRSTDGSAAALERGRQRIPALRVVPGPGRGVFAARNLAVREAAGDFVWFADCDDDWDRDIVARMLAATSAETDLVVCNAVKAAEGQAPTVIADAAEAGDLSGAELFTRMLSGQIQGHLWNKLFRRSLLGDDPFPPTRAHSDFGGLLRMAPRVRRAVLVPAELYRYQVRAGSILNTRSYRWDDLVDCSGFAHDSAAQLGWSEHDERLRAFDLELVIAPLLHESIRREPVTDPLELVAVRERCRRSITVLGLVALARRHNWLLLARLGLYKCWPAAYCSTYRYYRGQRWQKIDAALTRST